jgi:predicted nucleotidyltransferase component of viral defense system
MIPKNFIEIWQSQAPWQSLAMVEQDLIISRILVELYNNPQIRNSLVFRGGTALNKLYLDPPSRYSEDIDFVQINPEPIGKTIEAIQESLESLFSEPIRKVTERSVKLIYRYNSIDNIQTKLKLEINTTEHFQVLELQNTDYQVDSVWFKGKTKIVSYQLEEMIATKLRALYQRRKGRDLFDLWLVLKNNLINTDSVINIFRQYCKKDKQNITRSLFEQSLYEKQLKADFQNDMNLLLLVNSDWSFAKGLELVQEKLIYKIPGEPWNKKL